MTLWTIAYQAPLSMGFPRKEYWSGLPCASPGDIPDPEIKPESPALQADSLLLSHQKVKVKSLSGVRLFLTPWTVAYQVPPSMGFSSQECWTGLPFPPPGDLPDPGIEPRSPCIAGRRFTYRLSHQGSPKSHTHKHQGIKPY